MDVERVAIEDLIPKGDMVWVKVAEAVLAPGSYYLVKTNAGEWGDHDLEIMRARMIEHRLQPHYVRGRPRWVAKITEPDQE